MKDEEILDALADLYCAVLTLFSDRLEEQFKTAHVITTKKALDKAEAILKMSDIAITETLLQ